MASDLSSGCTEVNDILDDEKEEGEISLEDVSSSEEGPTYKYLPRTFGQCRYCLSMQHCATWCSSLTVNKNNIKRDAGLQGKENRSNRCYHKDGHDVPILGNSSSSKSVPYSSSTLQEKNDDDTLVATATNDLVPISSDSDMEVVGLTYDKHAKKSSHRRKLRKKRRKKSRDPLSLSLSPSPQDVALSIKDSIHRIEKDRPESGHSKHRHHSPDRKKFASRPSPPSRRHNRSPLPKRQDRRRTRSPLRKTSPVRSRKTSHQKKSSSLESATPEKKTFNKLLKKVRKLEPSSRNKEKGSSLKDKLNNIIKHDKKETSAPNEKSKEPPTEPAPKEEPKVAIEDKEELVVKEPAVEEKKNKGENNEDIVVLHQIPLETKPKKNDEFISPEDVKTEPVDQSSAPSPLPQELPPLSSSPLPLELAQLEPEPQPSEQKIEDKPEHKLPNFCMDDNDEDLKLRMIALRSAVIKKHQTRIASGRRKKPEATVPRIESPFTSTFLEDFPLLAEICSPTSPLSSKRDILSAEDMELDSDMELAALSGPEDQSPYSPSDDIIGELLLEHEIAQTVPVTPVVQPIDKNRSLYSPSNPTETPIFPAQELTKQPDRNSFDGSILEFTNQESRPYSPSDATVYDPDLPGVHSPVESVTLTTTTTTTLASLPLQPPPLPPLSMFGPQQTMLLRCPPNILNAYGDPITMVPPLMVTNFPALHQSVNPLLLPNAPPLFAYSPPQPASVPVPPLPIPSTTMTETNELDNFMETDLDGSPLVPIEKDGNEQKWPMLGEPLYLQNVPEITQSNLSKLPTLMERNLVPAAVLRSNRQLQKQPFKKPLPPVGDTLFRNAEMRPVALEEKLDVRCASFKPIKLQALPKRSVTTQPDVAFNSTLDDVTEEEEKLNKLKMNEENQERLRTSTEKKEIEKTDRRRKSKKSLSKHSSKELDSSRRSMRNMVNERRKDLGRRVRERSCRLSRARSVSKSISKTKKREEAPKKETQISDDKRRRSSVDDDEEALRESLLASLAIKSKEQTAAPRPPSPAKAPAAEKPSTESIPKSTDEMPLAERVSAFLAKSKEKDLKNSIASGTTTVSTVTTAAQPLRKTVKRLTSMTPASKVVNNAKRYQNLIHQRKLTQQMGSAAIKSRFKLSNTNESRSTSPVVTKLNNDIQKIVINLNEDTESESERDEAKCKINSVKVRPTLNIPTTDFEKSVDEFLKNARQQQEMTSTVNKNNVVLPKPVEKILPSMDPPPISPPSVSKAITANTSVTTAKITVATPPIVGSVGSIVATTANAIGMAKDKIISTPKVMKITTKIPSTTATPMAMKHLTESTQEEYRRLKQILQRAKAKESISTTAQPQSSVEKTATTSTSSPLSSTSSSSICPSSTLTSSTPKAVMPPVSAEVSSLSVKPHEQVLVQNKPVPKNELMATISSISKPSSESSKIPIVPIAPSTPVKIITSTKIIHATTNISQNNIILNKSASVAATTSINKISAIASPKVAATTLKITPQSNNNMFINKHQAALLGKMSEALSSQNKQISAVAQKVSSLRILTKEQINLKSSQIQQTQANVENNVVTNDLNITAGSNLSTASKRVTGGTNTTQSTKNLEYVTEASTLENNSNSDCTKILSVEVPCTTNKTKQNSEDFREVVNDEVQALSHLPAQQQKELLSKTEESLIEKRRSVVDDIAEMSLKLREWEIERDLQYKYTEEAKKLRDELKKVEEKIQQQKTKLNTIHPQVSLYHKKINNGRKECFKLSKICSSLGQQIIGSDYNIPTAGAEVLNNRIKEVVKHTQKLQNKKTQYIDTVNNNLGKTDNMSSKKNFKPNNLSKRREVVEKNNLNNNETVRLVSNSISVISASKNEEILIGSNNVNTCTNEQIIVNPKIENDSMDTSTESLNTSMQNTDTNSLLTSTELTNSVLNLNKSSNLETITHNQISETSLNTAPKDNLKTINISANLNNNSEIIKINNIFNAENGKQLRETENIMSYSENTGNEGLLAQNNLVNTISTINNSESEPITNGININNVDNQKSVIQSSVENIVLNTADNENQNLSTVINITKPISNEENVELTNTENQTLQTISTENNMIKTEIEETTMETTEIPTSVQENVSLQIHDAKLNNINIPSKQLSSKSEVEKMELDSENTNNESETLSNANSVENNTSVDDYPLTESQNKEHEIKIKLEVEEDTNSTSEIRNNIENLSSVDVIPVPELAEESVLSRKKSRNVKSVIKKKPTKTQQRKMYNKQVKLQLMAAENNTISFEDTMKRGIQPYESVLKPLRAPRNNTNGFLCPFEMQGTCNDGDCKYIHSSLR